MKTLFIVNPAAGGSQRLKKITEAVRKVLSSTEGLFEIRLAKEKGMARELSKKAVEMGFEVVFACGGDGTVNEVATPLVGTSVVLGIIPAGGGSGLASSLGIPRSIEDGVALIKKRNVRAIDVGEICGRYFFSTAGLGFDAHLNNRYNEGGIKKRMRGLLPYFPLSVYEFLKYKPESVVVDIDGQRIRLTPFILTVANTERYGSDLVIAPGAEPDDGFLDVCIVPQIGITDAAGAAKKLLKGKIAGLKGFKTIRAEVIKIYRDKTTTAHVDGEPFVRGGDILIKTHYRKLKVLVA